MSSQYGEHRVRRQYLEEFATGRRVRLRHADTELVEGDRPRRTQLEEASGVEAAERVEGVHLKG